MSIKVGRTDKINNLKIVSMIWTEPVLALGPDPNHSEYFKTKKKSVLNNVRPFRVILNRHLEVDEQPDDEFSFLLLVEQY